MSGEYVFSMIQNVLPGVKAGHPSNKGALSAESLLYILEMT